MPSRPGTLKFTYRAHLDYLIAKVDWSLETEDDVLVWTEQYRTYFTAHFDRKVDLILELSDFQVSPRIGTFFGKYRAQILGDFTRRSYRVNQAPRERTFMYTSSALHGAAANHYTTIEAAVEALLADRKAEPGRI